MTTTDDVLIARVSGPEGLLATIPVMLGFHPARSLVLLCLTGPRRRVGPAIRMDLPAGRGTELAQLMAGYALRFADEVVVATYQDSADRPPVLDALLRRLSRRRVPVVAALMVHGGRACRTFEGERPGQRSWFDVPNDMDPQVQELAAATAIAGRTILLSREALASSVAGPTGERLEVAERAITAAAGGSDREGAGGDGPFEAAPRDRDAVNALVDRCLLAAEHTGEVPVSLAARLAVAVQDIPLRDVVFARAMTDVDRPWPAMLIGCAVWTPDAQAAELCALLAAAAYRHGDGALAQVSVDRTLKVEPRHPLGRLLVEAMARGLHPDDLGRLGRTGQTAPGRPARAVVVPGPWPLPPPPR